MTAPNDHRLKADADGILELVREVVQELRQVLEGDDWKTKEAQLRAIGKTVESLEAVQVSVPEDLRRMKTDLAAGLAARDEAEQQLEALVEGLSEMVAEMRSLGVGRASNGQPGSSQRIRRPSGPRLEDAYIGDGLLEALRQLGGSAHCRTALAKMSELLQGKLTPRDEQVMKDGRPSWHNKAYKERERLIEEGLLKDNSRIGYWELREENT